MLVSHCLIDHVPTIDDILVTVDDSVDVIAETLVEYFLLDELSLLVVHHPVGKLAMPHEAMSTHRNVMTAAPVGYTVGSFPFPDTFSRMKLARFHRILAGDAVVVGKSNFLFCIREVACVECHAYLEIIFVSVLESFLDILRLCEAIACCHASEQTESQGCSLE